MRVYLAGKLGSAEGSIGSFADELEDREHTVTCKWWELPKLDTPYLEHTATSTPAADEMAEAVLTADVCILFPNERNYGAMTELGIAIADKLLVKPNKEILVVDPWENRQSVFHAHSGVLAVRGLAAIRERDWF